MGNLIFECSKSKAEDNVSDFISFCKSKLNVYGSDFDWNSNVWKGFYTFRKLDAKKGILNPQDVLDCEFLDFAKSFIIYHQALGNKVKLKEEMRALKLIEKSLLQLTGKAKIINCTIMVFDNAIRISKSKYSLSVVNTIGKTLERISKFLIKNNFVNSYSMKWVSPIRAKKSADRQSIEEIIGKDGKLSDLKAMEALASIFAKEDHLLSLKDIFTTSIFALLMCAPCRINEILSLSEDCEIFESDSEGIARYGLRIYTSKGAGADIKWISTAMVPVAKKAIARLRRISEQARGLAQWHENLKEEVFMTATCPNINPNKPLTVIEVCQALGYDITEREKCKDKLRRLVLNYGINNLIRYDFNFTLKSLWNEIRNFKPKEFPYLDQYSITKYSNALCLINEHQLHPMKDTNEWKLYRPTYSFFMTDINKNSAVNKLYKNIFERHGFYDEHGIPFSMHSHQPRHLLNTFAKFGGMSELNIARWSGRRNIYQNKYYDHTSKEHMQSFVKALGIDDTKPHSCPNLDGDINKASKVIKLENLTHGAYLFSTIGYCQHNYAITPCSRYPGLNLEDINSSLKEKIEKLISINYKDKEDGVYGAERWLNHNLIHLKGINNN